MRFHSFLTVALVCVAARAGAQSDLPLPSQITMEEFALQLPLGKLVVIDVRGPDSYRRGHIPGALSVPLDEIEAGAVTTLDDKTKHIVAYCACLAEESSNTAARAKAPTAPASTH